MCLDTDYSRTTAPSSPAHSQASHQRTIKSMSVVTLLKNAHARPCFPPPSNPSGTRSKSMSWTTFMHRYIPAGGHGQESGGSVGALRLGACATMCVLERRRSMRKREREIATPHAVRTHPPAENTLRRREWAITHAKEVWLARRLVARGAAHRFTVSSRTSHSRRHCSTNVVVAAFGYVLRRNRAD